MWDVHNGECLRTAILSNSPPLSQGKFTKTSDIALFSSLNSKVSLFNVRTGKLLREYHGHNNNEYLVETAMSSNLRGDLDGFFIGSENGLLHRFDFLQETPIDSLAINTDGQTVDLVLQSSNCLFVSGRAWQSVVKVTYPLRV